MNFNQSVRNRRMELKLSMKDVAEKVNISIPTYSRYENGEIVNVRHDKIKLLADALQTSPGYLMGWIDEAENSAPLALEENEKRLIQKFRRLSFDNQSAVEKYFSLSDKEVVNRVIMMAFENESFNAKPTK